MRGIGGAVITFLIAMSMAGTVIERGRGGAHQFDLGPPPQVAPGQVYAIELKATGGVRTAREFPKFSAVFLTRTPGGRLTASPNITPVAGCLLIFRAPTGSTAPAFVDPCEGGVWDVNGAYVSGRETQDLLRVPLVVAASGHLTIDTLEVAARIPDSALASPTGTPAPAGAEAPSVVPDEPAPSEWVLVPIVAEPTRSERSGIAGTLVTQARQWGLTPIDLVVLMVALILMMTAIGILLVTAIRRGSGTATPGAPQVYVEWRSGRRWALQPGVLTLRTNEERRVSLRLANFGKAVAAGASITFDVDEPLTISLVSRFGAVTEMDLPGQTRLRWEFKRRLPAGARSPVARLRLGRVDAPGHAALTREIIVQCRLADGGQDTRTSIPVRLVE
jgi:hypothetical protein